MSADAMCAGCDEPLVYAGVTAYAPYADGVVCSALCYFRATMREWTGDAEHERLLRVGALDLAVTDGVEFPYALCFTLRSDGALDTVTGSIWQAAGHALEIEDMDGHPRLVSWPAIIDVRLAPDA